MASLSTFNLHGFNNGCDFLKSLCQGHSIICIQEHWLRSSELCLINNIATGFNVYALSAMDDDVPQTFSGRPYGGLAILVNNSLFKVINLGYSFNRRVQALMITMNDVKILLFNVYFPCLASSVDYDADLFN
jgi:hypothetical protein